MKIRRARLAAACLLLLARAVAADAPAADAPRARVEARSADLLAVGTVQGTHMTIHLSRLSDNAPVRDAAVNVVLRGTAHAAKADTDGSYAVETQDLGLPGAAAVQFQVTLAAGREVLNGTLDAPNASGNTQASGNSRQLGWWLLNFAVCFGFLMLWRKRKGRGT